MTTQLNIQSIRSNIVFASVAALLIVSGQPSVSQAESWELSTAPEEVPGTRAIEAGDLDKGINISKSNLQSVPYRSKSAMLSNLCMSYTLKREYDTATEFCDRAINHPSAGRVAYNNRGVLRALQGDYEGAQEDFGKAAEGQCLVKDCSNSIGNNQEAPKSVAQRNLGRAEVQFAAIQAEKSENQQTARADQ